MADEKNYSILENLHNTFMTSLEGQLSKAGSQKEIDEILNKFDKIDLSKILGDTFDSIAVDTTRFMRDTMYEQVTAFRAEEQEFLARQEQKWYKAFVASESMYIMTLEAAEVYVQEVNQLSQERLKAHSYTFTAMLHIHGRAMQQFLEIVTLMKNGFADGAYARWRSMYELVVISSFIIKNGEEVAKAFIESSNTDDRYDWAGVSGLFPNNKRHITFNDIQKKCGIDSEIWRGQYTLANKTVHASSQGTFARLSNLGEPNVISVGRSDYGITTPAEHSAISLAHITTMFFAIYSTENSILSMKYITNWIDVIREEYFKTHDYVFPNDEKMWDDSLISYEDETIENQTDK